MLHDRGTPNVKTRAIRSQAIEGIGSMEGSTTREVSPNNNLPHERPTLRWSDEIVWTAWRHADL